MSSLPSDSVPEDGATWDEPPQPPANTASDSDARGLERRDDFFAHVRRMERVKARLTSGVNQTFVTIYKFVGFFVLSVILFGLISYVCLNALFFLHTGWLAPAIMAPTDEAVLELRARLAEETWNRNRLEVEEAMVGAQLQQARRTVETEEQYQANFLAALSLSADLKKGGLEEVRGLRKQLEYEQRRLEAASSKFRAAQNQALQRAADARLINRQEKATGEFRLAELKAKQVALKLQRASLVTEMAEVANEVESLDALRADPARSAPTTVAGLDLKRTYISSVLAKENAKDSLHALELSKRSIAEAKEVYDRVLSIIRESPLLLAADGELTLAFVPYDNLSSVPPDAPVFACAAYVIWCSKVGRVGARIEGEVLTKHPLYGHDIRGTYVRLDLDEPAAATKMVLHAGRRPLFL